MNNYDFTILYTVHVLDITTWHFLVSRSLLWNGKYRRHKCCCAWLFLLCTLLFWEYLRILELKRGKNISERTWYVCRLKLGEVGSNYSRYFSCTCNWVAKAAMLFPWNPLPTCTCDVWMIKVQNQLNSPYRINTCTCTCSWKQANISGALFFLAKLPGYCSRAVTALNRSSNRGADLEPIMWDWIIISDHRLIKMIMKKNWQIFFF